MRITVIATAICLSVVGFASADSATAAIRRTTNIPAEGLGPALTTLAKDYNFQVLYRTEIVGKLRTGGVSGAMTAAEALEHVLNGTGLSFRYLDAVTVTIFPLATTPEGATAAGLQPLAPGAGEGRERDPNGSRSGLQLARANQTDVAQSNPVVNNTSSSFSFDGQNKSGGLDEIVVTAQKRSEKLMDVPISITAISGERLESQQVNSLADLASYVPGLTIQDGGAPGERAIVIRGLSTGYSPSSTPPLVATYIDDAPVGSTTGSVRGAQYGLDLMPYDLDRIEVLQGPQSTLYGADAMGGIVKYVLAKPNLTGFDARVGGDFQDIDHGGNVRGTARGSVDLPMVADELGLRLSGYYQSNPGYVDNVGVGVSDSNHSTEGGGRAAILWKPTDRLALDGNFLFQHIDANDQTGVTLNPALQPIYGRYTQSTYFLQPFKQTTMFGSVTVNWDMDFATLTSSSSWSRLSDHLFTDLPAFGPYVPLFGGPSGALAASDIRDHVKKYVEEVRLASSEAHRVQWMLGGYFTREQPNEDYSLPTYTSEKVSIPYNLFLIDNGTNVFQEQAVFGNATYKLSDRFDVSGGLRFAENRSYGCMNQYGLFNELGTTCSTAPYQRNTTWMTNARFHLDQDTMLYARVATGYRPGGGCTGCGNAKLETPDFYYSDSLINYEGGLKAQLLEHRLQVDLSVFYIDWKHIQLTFISPEGAQYTGNGGTASSSGFELATSYQITNELRANATLAYTDAHLTQDIPRSQPGSYGAPAGFGGNNGDQLPESARWTGSFTADYRRPLAANMSVLVGGGYRYRDKVYSQFASSSQPVPLGPQNIVDFYTGFSKDKVTMRLYAKNLFNNYSYTGLLYLVNTQPAVVPLQPRTVGLSVDYQF